MTDLMYSSKGFFKGILCACLFFAAFLTGCRTSGDQVVLKLGHSLDQTHSVHRGMEYMAELAYEKSDGQIRIDIYPSQQLGTERETLELLQIGSLDITKVSASLMESFVRSFRVFSLPYLFRDSDHLLQVLESDIGRELLLDGEDVRVRGLTYYDAGSRSFYTTGRPIQTPADLAGMNIRTQESPTAFQMIRSMGGSATPIAWGELYTALQQGVVNGAENNPPSFYLSRHYEVAPYYSLNEHAFVPDVLVISKATWESMTPEQRQWLQEAADESAVYQRELWRQSTEDALQAVEEAGVEIIYPDKEPFMQSVEPMLNALETDPVLSELISRIRSM